MAIDIDIRSIAALLIPSQTLVLVQRGFREASATYKIDQPPAYRPSQMAFLTSTTSNPLEKFRLLDRSSSKFHDQVNNILCGEEYNQWVPNLQCEDSVGLVDCLDKVCCCVPLIRSPLRQPQALDTLEHASPAFRKCLRELRHICGVKTILPTSYMLSSDLLNVGPDPLTSRGSSDVYEGILGSSRVCIKRVRVYAQDDSQQDVKVRYRRRRFPCLLSLTKLTGLLQRGRNVEALDAPKYRAPPGCYYYPAPAHFELDVRRGSDGTHQEIPRCRPTRTCRFLSCCTYPHVYPHYQLSDVARGLCYLHSSNVIHGDLRGVRSPNSRFSTVLTPSQTNVLVDNSGRARIADFGVATVTQNLNSMGTASLQRGHTLRWTAPEVLNGEKYSKEADTFSFAMVMIEVRRR